MTPPLVWFSTSVVAPAAESPRCAGNEYLNIINIILIN